MANDWEVVNHTPIQSDGWAVASQTPHEQPGFASALWNQVNPMNSVPAFYHALTDRSEFAAMARDPQFGADLADATKRKQFVGPPAPGQTMYGQRATSQTPEDVPSYGQIAGNMAGMGVNAGLAAAAGPVMGAAGRVLRRAAVPVMESGLGVSAIQRGYGKTPGLAALEETRGIRPATVAASARQKMGLLNDALEQDAANSPNTGSLQPAVDIGQKRLDTALGGNSSGAEADLQPMINQLTVPGKKFAGALDANGGVAPDQSALQLLRMKREFGKDHTKWNMLHPNSEMGTARQMYHGMDLEFDKAVPGGAEKNQLISSLIPVAEDADKKALNGGLLQNALHRAATHNGSMAATAVAGAAGGLPAALATVLGQETVALPATRIAAARGLYGTGRGLASTAAQRAAQAALLSGGLLSIGQQKRRGLLE